MQSRKLPSFSLSSEQCELLLAFELAESLSDLADHVGRDISAISRQLQRMAQAAPVLSKDQGRWRLTPLGVQMNRWTRDAATAQRRVLDQQTVLRIAATREFAARVLAPSLTELIPADAQAALTLLTAEEGIERLLLTGEADLGFDCGRPKSPLIRFKRVQREEFCVVASPRFLKQAGIGASDATRLLEHPHLQYDRASTPRMLRLSVAVPNVLATFNDIAPIREACMAGAGWALLPVYSVRRELDGKALVRVSGWQPLDEHFGVWWAQGRTELQPWVEHAIAWLKKRDLS